MEDYKNLLERSIRCQETNKTVAEGLLKVAGEIREITNKLNDSFILHNRDTVDIKETLMKWLKWTSVIAFIAVGGSTVLIQATNLLK